MNVESSPPLRKATLVFDDRSESVDASVRETPVNAPTPRRRGLWLLTCGILAAGGCQKYVAAPIDVIGHRDAFAHRTPADERVVDYARTLATPRDSKNRKNDYDPTDGVGPREAELIALVYNGDVRLARAKAGVAAATAENAGLWADPTLGANLMRMIDGSPSPWKTLFSVGFTIPISGSLELEKAAAGSQRAFELAKVLEAEWSLRARVRAAWAQRLAAARKVEVLGNLVKGLEGLTKLVETIERAGEAAKLETGLFRIDRAMKVMELREAEGALRESEESLLLLMGLPPGTTLAFEASEPESAPAASLEALISAASQRNLAIASAKLEHDAMEHELELEIRRQYPDLMIGPGVGRENGSDEVILDLSVPLPLLNRNRKAIAEATARREASRVEYEVMAERVQSELAMAHARWTAAVAKRRVLETELLPVVDEQYETARRVAELGEVNTMVLLQTLTRREEAKLSLVEARLQEHQAAATLMELVGPEKKGESHE